MKTLIITVGTRQVGWRCRDGIVRCLGADGARHDPQHTDELYRYELQIERRAHHDVGSDRSYAWSVWDLGQRLLQYCQQHGFQAVELLLDQQIISEQIGQELSHVILWGTQQPEEVSWNYRRLDTVWLAELIAGKLRETYPWLQIKVFSPVINAVHTESVSSVLETQLLPYALQMRQRDDESFTILIENKGATPAIAEGLSICTGALVRQCQIVIVRPIEPQPLFQLVNDAKTQTACCSTEYQAVHLSSHFWPLERSRVISAWECGDFQEARVWLKAHQNEHQSIYELTQFLTLATNWQIDDALKALKNWIATKGAKRILSPAQQAYIQSQIVLICAQKNVSVQSKLLKIWESTFLIWLELKRGRYSLAFIYFSQTLERLLFLRYQTEDWIASGYIVMPEDKKSWGTNYKATFGELRMAWRRMHNCDENSLIMRQFKQINELRNSAVHKGEPLTLSSLATKLFSIPSNLDAEAIYYEMEKILQEVCHHNWQVPQQPVLRLLYQHGLDSLNQELYSR